MSRENPTPEELSEIEQFQHGAYGAEPPTWFTDPPGGARLEKTRKAVLIQVEGESESIYFPDALVEATKDYDDQTQVTIRITKP